jgi:hypothetical protein
VKCCALFGAATVTLRSPWIEMRAPASSRDGAPNIGLFGVKLTNKIHRRIAGMFVRRGAPRIAAHKKSGGHYIVNSF